MEKNLATISKFLSYVLRHKPESIGLEIDAEGWANIDEIIDKANIPISLELLHMAVEDNDKKRFSISSDGLSIRANQGHSIDVNLGLEAIKPPDELFHGTTTRFIKDIMQEGLQPQSRQYVHLSTDILTASNVGKRHGEPVVLNINTLSMYEKGFQFFKADNGVWLTKSVPAEFIVN